MSRPLEVRPTRRRFGAAALALAAAIAVPAAAEPLPLIATIDHLFVVSDDSERLFRLFAESFGLSVVWPFATHGDFASGGLSLGNTVLEFVREGGGKSTPTELKGIAFEPSGDAEQAVAELDARGIAREEPVPFTYEQDGREVVGWVTFGLPELPPASAWVFFCDYRQRARVNAGREAASQELRANGGGALGVVSLREIVVAVRSLAEASRQWAKLLDPPAADPGPELAFGRGPRIRLVQSEAEGIRSLVVEVASLARAKQFLVAQGMLGEAGADHRLAIAPAAIGGLEIVLTSR